jgi:acetyltransferase
MSVRHLESLFSPRSVAVVGVSSREGSVGGIVLRNLQDGGFKGPVWAVGLHGGEVAGLPVWPDVDSLPGVPELAVICTPAPTVPALVAALGARGTRAVIVLSAGLRDAHDADGRTMEQAMLDAARPYLLRILGPNCIGELASGVQLNASFSPCNSLPGALAFITQSGALATAMLDWATTRGIGFSHFISLGDSADVDFGDVLDYLASDPGTRAILMYAESIKHARKFMSAARAASRNKPVIVVKAGRASEGAKAAASHTGALAGSDTVFDAALRRAGMLRVDTLEDLFDAAETLARAQRWRGERLAMLTNGGGAGVLAADALSLAGGKLAQLSGDTLAALDACLPASWSHGNPVDIIGDAPAARYAQALAILMDAPEVDGVLFMHAPTAIVPAPNVGVACLPLLEHARKPVLACWLGGASVALARQAFGDAGIACHDTPERAARAWMQMVNYHRAQAALLQLPLAQPEGFTVDAVVARTLLAAAQAEGREWLDPAETMQLLRAYGIPTVETTTARDVEHAIKEARRIGYPVALKIISPQIVHKSDSGGVMLGIASPDELRAAAVRMRQSVALHSPGAHVIGFTVQAMAARKGALELIAGIASDPVFGPVVLFGEGGTAVELHNDHAVALAPLNAHLVRELIGRTRLEPVLAGWRGKAGVDRPALEDALLKVAQMAADLQGLAELDINPLLADSRGVLAVDARVRVRPLSAGAPVGLAISPYPVQLEGRISVGDTELALRPIRPDDGARLAAFYDKASPLDMRLRFFMAKREVPVSELARYCQIDYDREMTFIALAPPSDDESQAIAGEVRAVCDPDNDIAEFAIQIASAWQGRGLGRQLLQTLLEWLRARGTGEVRGQCMAENTGMASLARHAGFVVSHQAADDLMDMRLVLSAAAQPFNAVLQPTEAARGTT